MRYNKEIKNDMTRKLYFTILSLLFISTIYAQYVPDILGDNYLRRTIQMPDDYEGITMMNEFEVRSYGGRNWRSFTVLI